MSSAAAQRTSAAQRDTGVENLLFGVFIAAVLVGLVVWGTGELASVLAGKGPTGLSLGDMPRVLGRLPQHVGDPGRAWPRGVRRSMPGPVVFYMIGTVILAAVSALVALIYRFARSARDDGAASKSSWASKRDLSQLRVHGPQRGRLVLGSSGSSLLAAEERQSVIVLGPTQSMKTSGFAIPAILEWDGPVLATSVKSDLLRDTLAARRARGDVWVYDPTASTGLPSSTWSPLTHCEQWQGAQRTATWLTGAARGDGSNLPDADFWYAAAAKQLGPYLYAAAHAGLGMADVVRWIDTQEEDEVRQILRQTAVKEALNAAQASWKRDSRQKSSVYTTTETVLAAYADPAVAASAAASQVTPEAFLDGSSKTLYVCAPTHEQRRLRPLFETLIQSILAYAYERASVTGGPLPAPLLVVLDEAANIAPLRDLDSLASTAAGQGIQLVTIWQDLSQIANRYQDRAYTVVNNHRGKVVLSGISDPATLEYVSRVLGDEEVLQSSITRNTYGGNSTTQSTAFRSVAPASVLRGIKPGEGILVYGHLPPARLRLRPWFQDRALKQLASSPSLGSLDRHEQTIGVA